MKNLKAEPQAKAAKYVIEDRANIWLSYLPNDRRPETTFRRKIVSVAAMAKDAYEAACADGHCEIIPGSTVRGWLGGAS